VRALVGRLAARARKGAGSTVPHSISGRRRAGCQVYLPQDVELFAGTVPRISAVSNSKPVPRASYAAAKEAGVHEMIIKMRDGYDTQIR